MALEIVDFHPRHLDVMDMRGFEKGGAFGLDDAMARVEIVAKGSIAAATFIHDGRILFCAGFNQLWKGVIEVWMVPSVYVDQAPVTFGRTIRRYIERIEKDFKTHRLQTTSYDDPFHEKWMAWLGFEKEGTLKKFTHDKKNMCVYARVQKDG